MRSIDVGFLDRDPVEVVGSHAQAEAVEVGEAEASVAEARLRRVLCPGVEELASACADRPVEWAELGRLATVDPTSLSDVAKVDLLRALERVRAQLDAAVQGALAAVADATRGCGLDGEFARHEVAAALRLSSATAQARVQIAEALTGRLPATLAALGRGEITYLHARHLAETTAALDPTVATAVETRVLPAAGEQSLGEFRRAVEHAVLALDPAGAQARHEAASARRGITRHRQPDAMEGWWVTLPATAAGQAWDTLTAEAKATRRALRAATGADPGLDALRADALIDAICGPRRPAPPAPGADAAAEDAGEDAGDVREAGNTGEDAGARDDAGDAGEPETGRADAHDPDPLPGWLQPVPAGTALDGPAGLRTALDLLPRCRCGGAQTVAVVVDLATVLGLADHPAEIPGYGPVSAPIARELAADRDWERWIVHPHTRQLLDRSPHTYRPGTRLRGYVAAAHRTCGFPGCTAPAETCDLDHKITFRAGGRTKVANLGPLCRAHHNAKTHGGWTITYDQLMDTWYWRSPLGATYPAGTDPPLRS